MAQIMTLAQIPNAWAQRAAQWCLGRDDLIGFHVLAKGTPDAPVLGVRLVWPRYQDDDPEKPVIGEHALYLTFPPSGIMQPADSVEAMLEQEAAEYQIGFVEQPARLRQLLGRPTR